MKKGLTVGDSTVYDMEKIYGRLLVLSESRDITLETTMSYELAPLPSAIFDEYGDLRKSSKASLLHKVAVWSEHSGSPDVTIIDGNEVLYKVTWPKLGTVRQLLDNFTKAVEQDHQVIVVFDRYVDGSIKIMERLRRVSSSSCPTLNLTAETSLTSRDAILNSTNDKSEPIKVFCRENDRPWVHMVGDENRV